MGDNETNVCVPKMLSGFEPVDFYAVGLKIADKRINVNPVLK